ncbi:MAG: ATP-binding cassette domain-containing protein [Propionibacteriaceae bacterium]|nr:ATP-binding cassette domain-containing protein [Propionibacteriaceae bacterium]
MSTLRWADRAIDWAVHAHGLTKSYGSKRVLRGLDFHVPRGGIHGLLGPNGSGKTTSIRILLGLVRADGGEAFVLGHEVPKHLPQVIGQVGAIVESPKFAPRMTGRHNLEVLAESIGVGARRVVEVLLEVGLAEDADRPFHTYSLGLRQRTAIAATLLKSPELLIFDEPTNGLDPAGIHDIRATMRQLADAGRTVLVSSHILSEIEQVADSVSVIGRGRILAEGAMDEILGGAQPHVSIGIDRASLAADVLRAEGWRVEPLEDGLKVMNRDGTMPDGAAIAQALGRHSLWPHRLTSERTSLEAAFLELTHGEDLVGTQGRRRAVDE